LKRFPVTEKPTAAATGKNDSKSTGGAVSEPIEIMAPAADLEMVRAAVENGARAVYAGMPEFNARAKTHGVTLAELAEMSAYARLRGVRFYLAWNVVLYETELERVPDLLLESLRVVSPDAYIVQDPGLALLLRRFLRRTKIHASTQMTIASELAARFYSDLSFDRITLPRELSEDEIIEFSNRLDSRSVAKCADREGGLMEQTSSIVIEENRKVPELELFVHGALCISYSGQCYTSENFGGRSANRGECAQSCRMQYDLIVDGRTERKTGAFYPFSPRDLSVEHALAEILNRAALVRSLKIEGRSKTPEYVAAAVRKFQSGFDDSEGDRFDWTSLTFSREKNEAWLHGRDYLALVPGNFNSHRGLFAGTVERVERGVIVVKSTLKLSRGDGIAFYPENGEPIGGPLFDIERVENGHCRIAMANGFAIAKIVPGMEVRLTGSPGVERGLRRTWSDREKWKRIPLSLAFRAMPGKRAELEFVDDANHRVVVHGEAVLEEAKTAKPDPEQVRSELEALGGTVYRSSGFQSEITGNPFLHSKELKLLRRKACEKMDELRLAGIETPDFSSADGKQLLDSVVHEGYKGGAPNPLAPERDQNGLEANTPFRLEFVVRSYEQLETVVSLLKTGGDRILFRREGSDRNETERAIREGVPILFVDFPMGESLAKAVLKLKESKMRWGFVTPRVVRVSDEPFLEKLAGFDPDEILTSSPAALQFFLERGVSVSGDFGLNVTNSVSASFFFSKGVSYLTPSPDLSRSERNRLVANGGGRMILPVRRHAAGFYMEFCLFARFLANAKDKSECGHVCTKHSLSLRDHTGMAHSVVAEKNCRNTLYYGKVDDSLDEIDSFRNNGGGGIRIDFLNESVEEIEAVIAVIGSGMALN